MVEWLCAVQAQDYPAAKWALGSRMRSAVDADVERAFDDGAILRTHLLRPTWHFVRPADIRWLLALTAPRVKAGLAYRHKQLELDARTLRRAGAAIGKSLLDGVPRTRDELREVLTQAGIRSLGVERMTHIMALAELDGIVCSGPRKGKQFTYALLDDRAPHRRTLARDAALAELASRYFRSRGPASVQDFAKWAGLTVSDARQGLESVAADLRSVEANGATLWFPDTRPAPASVPTAYLLSLYDELISSYRDRSAMVEPRHAKKLVGMGNALSAVIAIDGRVVGTWKRRMSAKAVTIETRHFDPPSRSRARAVAAAARRYGEFLGLPVVLG
ncbi:MAG TPA: winged helix DNA-binding domain-containing protein [Gemmatimonadota bacterium]|nr:winged helix DNA-binding domain-containing protein [Gemmatimonadota bacterium]